MTLNTALVPMACATRALLLSAAVPSQPPGVAAVGRAAELVTHGVMTYRCLSSARVQRSTEMRHREPRLTVRALRPLISGLSTLGYDPIPFLQTQGIDSESLLEPDATVPMSACVGLLADGVRATGDDNLGLHVAEHAELGSFDVHFYAMVSSPTLGAAFERVCRYQRLIHETSQVRLETSGDRAVLSHRLSGGMAAPRQTAELLLASWVRAGRVAAGTTWSPAEVRFAHREPRDSRPHERFFGAPLRFAAGENALVIPVTFLDLPCRRTDLSLLSLLDRYAADRLDRPAAVTFADRVRAALSENLQAENVAAHRLAAHLGVSVRTLNRTLAAEGTSYRRLLDQLRLDIAGRHLRDDRVSVAEVAFLTGFSELSAFHRAFKRWTGCTPAAFRARARIRPYSGTLA
jgi:AraC-like DNA-binding protein